MNLIEAAQHVLWNSGQPMHVNDIWSKIERRGLFVTAGRTPLQTLATSLLRTTLGVRTSKSSSVKTLYKEGSNTFGLLEWLDDQRRAELETEEALLEAAERIALSDLSDGAADPSASVPIATSKVRPPSGVALQRICVVPILRDLRDPPGGAAPKLVKQRIRDLYRDELSDGQFAHVLKNNHIRFTRLGLSRFGLVGGVYGWELTEAGGEHLQAHEETNRGDPARIFGELLYAIEYLGEPVDLALGGQLTVPPNLVLIGTMNSVDRSVAAAEPS